MKQTITFFFIFSKLILMAQINLDLLKDLKGIEEGILLEGLFDKETGEEIKDEKIFIKWNIPITDVKKYCRHISFHHYKEIMYYDFGERIMFKGLKFSWHTTGDKRETTNFRYIEASLGEGEDGYKIYTETKQKLISIFGKPARDYEDNSSDKYLFITVWNINNSEIEIKGYRAMGKKYHQLKISNKGK